MIEALTEKCKNLTVVLINGGPVEMPWINKVNSLIQTSYCGMHGGLALARVLFGEVNPSGHLAETYPVHLCDTPTENSNPIRAQWIIPVSVMWNTRKN